jgi:3-oxoacyl-[acyl-carrier-protein] synthase III
MHNSGTFEVRKIFEQLHMPVNEIRVIFPHTSSSKSWDEAAKPLGVEHLLYHVYPKYGNLVSASVPAAMALALAEGRFSRGDRIVGWVGSAGMSFAAYSFRY